MERGQGRRWAPLSCLADEEEGDMGRSSQKKKKEDGEDRTRRTGEEEEMVGGEGESVEKGGESETQTGRDKALEKGKEDVLKLLRGKRSQEVKEKEGKRKSEENGNGAGGRVVSRGGRIRGGGRKQEESYNAAVVSVSCVPRAGSPDWSVRAPGLRLHLGLSSWKETGLYWRILL